MSFPKELEDPTITFDGTKCADDSVSLIYHSYVPMYYTNFYYERLSEM